ncbi:MULTISPECIES: phosphoenolpyruvate--protein phosphotransferase [Advenella]|jgi:phosphotransferase system enzyme I (PtsI)|uniref:phosphoenolpyruvate--protein phosphotransferase n=1 Tax=Advenella TaxID=290425 RepID=UPI002007186B|nr:MULTISPECIES: phosphoenolpyruvate--protein phosphotransferase [Advenella]WKU18677.1 phosphoenolpyruvate--protein phosphotransferase [Advenella alkanexedens]
MRESKDIAPSTAVMLMRGKGVARGFAIGRAIIMGAATLEVAHYRIATDDIPQECARLDAALETVYNDLQHIIKNLPPDAPKELTPLLNVHSLLVSDPMLSEQTREIIASRQYNAEWALSTQGQLLADQFSLMEDEYIRERAADVNQVIERVLRVLSGMGSSLLPDMSPDLDINSSIVVAHDISPADMLKLRGARFAAFVTDLGGATSHTAIVARSMNVPAVVGLGNIRSLVRDKDMLIVDGEAGIVIVNPSEPILAEYQQKQDAYIRERAELIVHKDEPAITLDGKKIKLEANIELPHEADEVMNLGADGIGLFRSEFLFMGRETLPDEEEQYEAYSYVLKTMQGKPVTIRTLDIGSDKTLDGEATVAANPALGLRAVRYCLSRPEMFQTQLRALLRASVHGKLRILIPMLSHMHELHSVKQAIEFAKNQLVEEGYAYADDIELGAMVEIPAIAIAIEPFLKHLDFVSIGTNDLIQYTLAIDRVDNEVSDLYDPMHPAVLRLISQTIQAGERAGKAVAVCGEMAGESRYTRLLLGLGLTEFSMHPQQLLDVKKIVRTSHTNALRSKIATALNHAEYIDLAALEI